LRFPDLGIGRFSESAAKVLDDDGAVGVLALCWVYDDGGVEGDEALSQREIFSSFKNTSTPFSDTFLSAETPKRRTSAEDKKSRMVFSNEAG